MSADRRYAEIAHELGFITAEQVDAPEAIRLTPAQDQAVRERLGAAPTVVQTILNDAGAGADNAPPPTIRVDDNGNRLDRPGAPRTIRTESILDEGDLVETNKPDTHPGTLLEIHGKKPSTRITTNDDSWAEAATIEANRATLDHKARLRAEPDRRFREMSVLGRGGVGQVALAADRNLRREVAIKTLLDPNSNEAHRRFIDEAQVTGQLEHPNIVPVHDLAVDATSRPFIVMKRVRGSSLADVLYPIRFAASEKGRAGVPRTLVGDTAQRELADRTHSEVLADPMPGMSADMPRTPANVFRHLLDVFAKVCDALAYAHSRGVIHRDLKPDNVMVGEFGEVLVMDWGLAKVIGVESSADEQLREQGARTRALTRGELEKHLGELATTAPRRASSDSERRAIDVSTDRDDDPSAPRTLDGVIAGTPSYMPPEQARGDIDKLDARCDVYSLGALLYEILSCNVPVSGQNVYEILGKVIRGEIERPSQRSLAPWPVPRELDAIVMKAMAQDPEDRYESVEALHNDLDAYLAGHTISAAVYSPWELIGKWVTRRKGTVAAAAAVLLVALAGIAGVISVVVQSDIETAKREEEIKRERMETEKQAEIDRMKALDDARADAEFAAQRRAWWRYDELMGDAERVLAGVDSARELGDEWANVRNGEPGADETADQRARREASLGAHLDALASLDRAMQQPIGDADSIDYARKRRITVASDLARIAALGGDYTLARHTANELRKFEASESEVASLLDSIEDRRNAVARSHEKRLREILDDLGTGLARADRDIDAPRLSDMIFEAVAWREPGTVRILADRLKPITARATEEGEAAVWSQEERDTIVFCARVLGRLGMDGVVEPLAELLRVLQDFSLISEVGAALCVTKRVEAHDPLIELRDRFDQNSSEWRAVQRQFMLVPLPARYDNPRGAKAFLERGDLLADMTRFDEARRDFETAIVLDPNFDKPYNGLGLLEWNDGNLEGAYALFQKSIALGNLDPAPYINLCGVAQDLGLLDRSIGYATLAISFAGDEAEIAAIAHCRRAYVHLMRSANERALADCNEAIALAPELAEAWSTRASVREAMGEISGARLDYDRAVRAAPHDPTYYHARGSHRSSQGDSEGAFFDFERAIELDPKFSAAYSGRGLARLSLGQREAARLDVDKAVQLAPADASVWYARALLRASLEEHWEAVEDFEHAISLAPGRVEYHHQLGRSLYALGEYAESFEAIQSALGLNPRHVDALYMLSLIYQANNENDAALEVLNRVVEYAPAHATYINNRGVLREWMGDSEGALEDYLLAVSLNPDDAILNYNVAAQVLEIRGDAEFALKHYGRAIELNPDYVAAWTARADVYERVGDLEAAEQHYRGAIRIAPDNDDVRNEFGIFLVGEGRVEEAIEQYSVAARLNPENAVYQHNLGDAYEHVLDYRRAEAAYTRAIEIEFKYAAAYYRRGRLRALELQNSGARWDLDDAIRYDDSIADAWYWRGILAYRAIDYPDAIRCIDRALALDPARNHYRLDRGRIHVLNDDLDSALADFEYLVADDPNTPDYRINLLRVLRLLGRDGDVATHEAELEAILTRRPEADPEFLSSPMLGLTPGRHAGSLDWYEDEIVEFAARDVYEVTVPEGQAWIITVRSDDVDLLIIGVDVSGTRRFGDATGDHAYDRRVRLIAGLYNFYVIANDAGGAGSYVIEVEVEGE